MRKRPGGPLGSRVEKGPEDLSVVSFAEILGLGSKWPTIEVDLQSSLLLRAPRTLKFLSLTLIVMMSG